MGANQSTITPDQFKDHIFSIVLYYIAPKANPTLKFVTRDRCGPDFLPIPDDPDLTKLLNYYNLQDPQVAAYMHKHVLNSEENMVRFYQTLIGTIRNGDTNDIPDAKSLQNGGGNGRGRGSRDPPDPLTRSRLVELDSSRRRERHPMPKPDRTGTDRPRKNIEPDTSRSSHFTMSKVIDDKRTATASAKVAPTPSKQPTTGGNKKTDINFTNSELEETKQKLIVNLLQRAEPYKIPEEEEMEEPEDYEEEEEQIGSSRHSSRKDSRKVSSERDRYDSRDRHKSSRDRHDSRDRNKNSSSRDRYDSRDYHKSSRDRRYDSRQESRQDSRQESRQDSRQESRPYESRQVSRYTNQVDMESSKMTHGGGNSKFKGAVPDDVSNISRASKQIVGAGAVATSSDIISVAPVTAQQFETDMNKGIEVQNGSVVDEKGKEVPMDDHTSHPKEVFYDDADEQTMKHKHRFREKCVIEDFE